MKLKESTSFLKSPISTTAHTTHSPFMKLRHCVNSPDTSITALLHVHMWCVLQQNIPSNDWYPKDPRVPNIVRGVMSSSPRPAQDANCNGSIWTALPVNKSSQHLQKVENYLEPIWLARYFRKNRMRGKHQTLPTLFGRLLTAKITTLCTCIF